MPEGKKENLTGLLFQVPTEIGGEKSAEVLAVKFANATSQGSEEFVGERRDGVNDSEELTLADDEHHALGFGDDRSGAGTVIKEREFADNSSGSESCNFLAVALHGGGSADDDESFAAGLTLINDQCASGETHLIGSLGDLFEVLVRARREERDFTEAFEVRLF